MSDPGGAATRFPGLLLDPVTLLCSAAMVGHNASDQGAKGLR